MKIKFLILNALMMLVVLAPPLLAANADSAWLKARAGYDALQDSPRRQQLRSEWDRVLLQFVTVHERDPQGEHAAEALFMAAKTLHGRYRVSRIDSDAWETVAMLDRVAREHPDSPLADDALLLAGNLLEKPLDSPEEAYRRFQQIVTDFPRGDAVPPARAKLNALVRYAPPPPASAAPAAMTVAPPASPVRGGSSLAGIRFWSNPGYTRVVLDLSAPAPFVTNFLGADPVENLPPRLFLDIGPATLDPVLTAPTVVDDGLLRRIRTGVPVAGKVRVVLDLVSIGQYKIFPLNDPYRIVIDISGEKVAELKAMEPALHAPPVAAAAPASAVAAPVAVAAGPQPEPPLPPAPAAPRNDAIAKVLDAVPPPPPAPALPAAPVATGLRRIVVDAGHGGKDPGAIGPSGLREKDVTLALARRLAGKLRETLACEVVLTRDRDVFLPLEERTAIANKVGADLFISVHANAAPNRQAFGVETYYLNFSKNDKAAAVAARENGTSLKEVGDLELILFDLMANSKINESSRLAAEIQRSLVEQLAGRYDEVRDLGVRQGPFYVLLGATMPSVLVEAAFISHPREEQRLASRGYQEQAAAAIADAVKSYALTHKLLAAR